MSQWCVVDKVNSPNHYEAARNPRRACIRGLAYSRHAIRVPSCSLMSRLIASVSSPPRVAMFGQGLEASTSGIVRDLMWGNATPFTVDGLTPGINGFGSGVTLSSRTRGIRFNLITIYEQSAAVRQNRQPQEQNAANSLLVERNGEALVLKPRVQNLCRTVDCFVCVVDVSTLGSNQSPSSVKEKLAVYQEEISQLLDARWSRCA